MEGGGRERRERDDVPTSELAKEGRGGGDAKVVSEPKDSFGAYRRLMLESEAAYAVFSETWEGLLESDFCEWLSFFLVLEKRERMGMGGRGEGGAGVEDQRRYFKRRPLFTCVCMRTRSMDHAARAGVRVRGGNREPISVTHSTICVQ